VRKKGEKQAIQGKEMGTPIVRDCQMSVEPWEAIKQPMRLTRDAGAAGQPYRPWVLKSIEGGTVGEEPWHPLGVTFPFR